VPVTEMIKESINRLIFMLDGGDLKYQQTFPGELIERDSIAPGRSPDVVSCHRHCDDDRISVYYSLYYQ
jgi:hypothetical protein